MIGQREHRSERPSVWDYANPRAEKRIPLRRRLASPPASVPKKKAGAPPGSPAPGPRSLT